ncbi:MAG: methyltransferase domain-containing protein [Myxococcales bacterium]|nr:methyltransferase domain-containing protein [Myxococcales bacterium]
MKDSPSRHTVEEAQFAAQRLAFGPIMFQATRILRDSGILDSVRRNPGQTSAQIAETSDFSAYACTVLLEAGLSAEVVSVDDDAGWLLTKVGYFILKDELTRTNMDFTQDVCYLAMFHLEEALRTERPAGLKVHGEWDTLYDGLLALPEEARESWLAFDHYYSDGTFPQAADLLLGWGTKSILDIGCNVGKFALVCLNKSSTVTMSLVDLPRMIEEAQSNIGDAGFAERVSAHPTDMLDPNAALPQGRDVIWMSQFLCCFSEDEVVSILKRAREAMSPDSRVVIMDTFWDCQKHEAATYSLHATSLYFTCLANGSSRMYDVKTMRRCLERANLRVDVQHDEVGLSHTILECRIAE